MSAAQRSLEFTPPEPTAASMKHVDCRYGGPVYKALTAKGWVCTIRADQFARLRPPANPLTLSGESAE